MVVPGAGSHTAEGRLVWNRANDRGRIPSVIEVDPSRLGDGRADADGDSDRSAWESG